MKALYTSIFILSLILAFSITSFFTIYNTKNEMLGLLSDIEETAKKEHYNETKKLVEDFVNKWEEKENILTIITRHEILDIIEAQVTSLLPLLEHKNFSMFYSDINKIKVYISRMAEEETLVFKNLF